MHDWNEAERHVDRALEMYERGRWAEAEAELRKALEIDPDQGDWHYNLGVTLERSGRFAEALASYEQASRLLPDALDARVSAGVACVQLGRWGDAASWLETALDLDETCEGAWAALIDARAGMSEHDAAETAFYMAQDALPGPSAIVLVAMSESLSERGDLDRATWCAREALKIDPDVIGGRLRLANVLSASGDAQQAAQLLLRELRDDPGNVQALLLHADVLASAGRAGEALLKLQRVLELEPANLDAHVRAGDLAMAANRWDEAFIAWGLVRRLDPGHLVAPMRLAEILIALGQAELAGPFAREFLTRLGESATTEDRQRCAEILLAAGDAEAAAEILEQLEGDRTDVDILRMHAVALFRCGKRDEGAAASRRVIRLEPTCTASLHNLAMAAMADDRYRAAWGWVRRGLASDPQDESLRRLRSKLVWSAIARAGRWLIGARR